MLYPPPDGPDPSPQQIPQRPASGLQPERGPQGNWLQARILEASRELLFAAEKVQNPIGATIEDQAPAAWHVRTSQALLDHCVEHLDDLDDEDPPGRRPRAD